MRLGEINDGLNVVVGPNEMGKSTLLDALRAVLFEKHDSRARPVRDLQNDRNNAGPVIELAFELNEGIYRIRKRFIKKPYARLDCPDGRTLEGDAAEEELRELLSLGKPARSGAQPETLGMWNVLWVKQGRSFGAPDLPESARGNLHGALESEVGTVLGGRRGRALPQVIEKQLGELVTSSTNKPRGQYRDILERETSLNGEIESFGERRAELSDTLARLEEAQETLKRLSSENRDETDGEKIKRARKRYDELKELETRIEAAGTELELRKLNLEKAEGEEKQRSQLKDETKAEEMSLEAAGKRRGEVREKERDYREKIEKLRAAVHEAEAGLGAAEDTVLRESRVLEAVRLKNRIGELERRFEKAREAETRRREAQREATTITVTEELIERIRAAEKELEKATDRLSAVATTITLDMEPNRSDGIEINGQPFTDDRSSIRAVSPVTITIPECGRITVEPAVKNRDKLLGQQSNAEAELKNALREAGAESPSEAENRYDEREKLLRDAELARQEAELHSPATEEYEAGAQALGDHIESLSLVLKRETDELALSELPALKESETALEDARGRAADARHALEKARAELSGPDKALGDLQTELTTADVRYEGAEEHLARLRSQLEDAEKQCPSDELLENIDTAQKRLLEQEEVIAKLSGEHEDETLEQLQARMDRLEKAIEERREKRGNLDVEISGLRSRVEASEGGGIDEVIQQKNRELELCQEEIRRSKREVDVLTLLLLTLRDAEREAKELYMSPVVNRLRPYLQLLFPGANIAIDENLKITGVVREGGYEEPFHHLSMGTQEQIAVLVRLAFAEMLVEQGQPATVVLDDALVFSDDRRMDRMFDILNMAARNIQVLIFTCREQLFEGIGGCHLSLETGDAEELLSA